ncbi:DUF1194 domain-containing protein [Jannaschia seohaensis]|uniref:Uncharacterized protein DUF1194 n=1 Tax=Jannaschia seohaensis TaxID=475081 RepID=A0A2Y9C8Y0_9RHOB|nr:DUF1194 domain-containing protein [Jannaschia seohaensis]PWJ13337.1 uncharacterized protein DUF1194 [Jannaschia seohaensis]SSA50663.1 Protein of unknown function [Jannaschia seohaensis]
MRVLALLALLAAPAFAQDTDLELVLLADASGSITQSELMFQRNAYAAAMTDPTVIAAIQNTAYGSIAVTYVEWATNQGVVVPWMRIDGAETAAAFAAALDGPPRGATGRNAIGSALLFARDLIEQNRIDGWRRVIDFSGDTTGNSYGPPIEMARDEVLESGITINALAIVSERRFDSDTLAARYEARIIGGPGAFVVEAGQGEVFAEAVKRKLILEISGVPTPRIVADLR